MRSVFAAPSRPVFTFYSFLRSQARTISSTCSLIVLLSSTQRALNFRCTSRSMASCQSIWFESSRSRFAAFMSAIDAIDDNGVSRKIDVLAQNKFSSLARELHAAREHENGIAVSRDET